MFAIAMVTALSTEAVAAPPQAPILGGLTVDDGTLDVDGELHFGVLVPVEDVDSAVSQFKVQWKSGSQGYHSSRQAVVAPRLPSSVEPGGETSYVIVNQKIRGLTNGIEYTVRVIATNPDGDGPPSVEMTATPTNSKPELLRQFILDLVEEYESSFPWLRETWNYMRNETVQLFVLSFANSKVDVSCTLNQGLYRCRANYLVISTDVLDADADSKKRTILHELAHIYTVANRLSASPAPLAMAHLYFDSLGSYCSADELYADIVAAVTLGGSTTGAGYWLNCGVKRHTNAASAVVRSALNGQTPAWFGDTYNDSSGNPDLEQVWADLIGLERDKTRKVAAYQLRTQFGGYCNTESAAQAIARDGDARAKITNPWRDGGCVPGAPVSLTAVAGDDGQVSLSWQEPASDGGSLLDGYKVEWKSGGEEYDRRRQTTLKFSDPDSARRRATCRRRSAD